MKRINLATTVSAMILTLLLVSGLLLSMEGESTARGKGRGRDPGSPTPDGYYNYLVFMTNGVLPEDEVFIFGEDAVDLFHKGVMGRSDDEIAANGAQAAGFFGTRFGIDVNDPMCIAKWRTLERQNASADYPIGIVSYCVPYQWLPNRRIRKSSYHHSISGWIAMFDLVQNLGNVGHGDKS